MVFALMSMLKLNQTENYMQINISIFKQYRTVEKHNKA